jgi:hypothetical protein
VLVENCYGCHSSEAHTNNKLKSNLLLDSRAGVRKGGTRGPAVDVEAPGRSLLLKAIRHEGELQMPPKGRLSADVLADFEKWIALGAPDPREGQAVGPLVIDWSKARSWWAFQSPRRHHPPNVRNGDWPLNEIDRFILATLEAKGLQPVRPASKPEWIRRATFDLIGLPPTPAEIEDFEKDASDRAYAKVVDRLLDSPHYGERWGRYWLDLARYTDDLGGTVGPVPAPTAFRYRDWVLNAFQKDMPYDRFVRLQVAGDLVTDPATDYFEKLGGLGFQGLGQRFSGNAVGMAKKKVADELDDRVDTVTRSLLGLTVSCARCHDHKFDPIPTVDYYSLAMAYNGAKLSEEILLASPQALATSAQWNKDVTERTTKIDQLLQSEGRRAGREEMLKIDRYLLAAWKLRAAVSRKLALSAMELAANEKLHPLLLDRWAKTLAGAKPAPLLTDFQQLVSESLKHVEIREGAIVVPPKLSEAALDLHRRALDALAEHDRAQAKKSKPSAENDTFLKVFLFNDGAGFKLTGKDVLPFLSQDLRQQHDTLQSELDALSKTQPAPLVKGPAVVGGGNPMQINLRGNAEELGAIAPPGFLQVLRSANALAMPTFTRLDLANAIATRDNPLTARVYVNRVWHYHFGRGIVGTLSNFGQLGDRPTHPELLDTLAVRFMENGWSTKWLHREIMLSATYRLSGAAEPINLTQDADNFYLWRMTPRRLDFEAWRDAMLTVSGKLDPTVGGPPFRQDKVQLQPEDPANTRRTIYGFISRFKPNPTLTLFDFPEPNVTSDQRSATTIPQQQLFVLNSPFVLAMAQAFAARVERAEEGEQERFKLAWQLAYGRQPLEREQTLARNFLRRAKTRTDDNLRPWEQLCHALLTSNEFAFVP